MPFCSCTTKTKSPFWCVCQSSVRPHLWWSFFSPISFFSILDWNDFFPRCFYVTSIAQSIHVCQMVMKYWAMLRMHKSQQLKFLGFLLRASWMCDIVGISNVDVALQLPFGNYSVSFTASTTSERRKGKKIIQNDLWNKATTNCELFYFSFTHFAAAVARDQLVYANHIWSMLLAFMLFAFFFLLAAITDRSHTHVKFNGHNRQQWGY